MYNELNQTYWALNLINWLIMSACVIGFAGIFVIYFPEHLTSSFSPLYRYGKTSDQHLVKDHRFKYLFIPKRWFLHFYVCANPLLLAVLWMEVVVYFQNVECPALIRRLLHLLSSTNLHSTVASESVVLATVLMICHMVQRLCECLFVNVFSNATMSVAHYAYAMFFYLSVALGLIIEAPGFVDSCSDCSPWNHEWWTLYHVVGTAIFAYGSWVQWQSNIILASLRKNKGQIVTFDHKVPMGGMFELVSCPQYFGEALVYMGVCIVFGGKNVTWLAILINVLTNQALTAEMSHRWYKNKFRDYPAKRKAFIPYIL